MNEGEGRRRRWRWWQRHLARRKHTGGERGGGGEEGGVGDGDVAVMERLAATTERRGDAAATMVVAKVAARVAVKAEVEEGGEGRGRVRYWLRQGAHLWRR